MTQKTKEIDYSVLTYGPLYFDEKYKKPGYKYALVSNKPGEIEMYARRGYEVVKDDIETGDGHANQSSPLGAAVTIQSKCGQTLVLMAITDELHAKFEAWKDSEAKKRDSALGKIDGIPDHLQYGNVSIDNKKY